MTTRFVKLVLSDLTFCFSDLTSLLCVVLCICTAGNGCPLPNSAQKDPKALTGNISSLLSCICDNIISKLPGGIPSSLLEKTPWQRRFVKERRTVFGEESAVCPDKPCLPVFLFQGKKCTTPSLFQFFHLEKLFLAHRKQMFFFLRCPDWTVITPQLRNNFIFLEGSGKTMDFHVRLVGEKLGRSLATRL